MLCRKKEQQGVSWKLYYLYFGEELSSVRREGQTLISTVSSRMSQGRKVGQRKLGISPLSLPLETKSRKVYSRSLPIARRGSDDGRHMGDSPGAHQEPRTFLSFLFSLWVPLMRARFHAPRMCAQKSRRHRESP